MTDNIFTNNFIYFLWNSIVRISFDAIFSILFGHICQTKVHMTISILTSGIHMSLSQLCCWTWITNIQGRSQTSYTAPCNGVVSHGALSLGFCQPTKAKTNVKTNVFMIFTCCVAYLSSRRSQQMQVIYAPDEPRLFWLREKPEDPKFEPHARIKMAQVLGFPWYIISMSTILQNALLGEPFQVVTVDCKFESLYMSTH